MKEITDYIEKLPEDRKEILTTIRKMIFDEFPGVKEEIEYKMPSFKFEGKTLAHVASQKHHISVYMNTSLVEKYRSRLEEITNKKIGKSCIRFSKQENFPRDLILQIMKEVASLE